MGGPGLAASPVLLAHNHNNTNHRSDHPNSVACPLLHLPLPKPAELTLEPFFFFFRDKPAGLTIEPFVCFCCIAWLFITPSFDILSALTCHQFCFMRLVSQYEEISQPPCPRLRSALTSHELWFILDRFLNVEPGCVTPIPKGRPKIWWNWDGVVAKFELGVERVSVTAWA